MSFTVPLNGCTIVATASVVTPCSSSADCPVSAAPMCCGGVCVARSCGGGGFTPDGAYDSVWDSVRPMTGKFFINYFQYQEVVGCICMLNGWFSSNDEICADNYIYFRFKLKGKFRSEKWEVYLFGDKTIKVERAQVQFSDSGDMPVVVTTGHGVQTCRKLWFSTVAVFGSSWIDGKAFWGRVHRYTARGDPRHQGGEGVAGTPGACSQAFCHPIRCMRCAFISTETCFAIPSSEPPPPPPPPPEHEGPNGRTPVSTEVSLSLAVAMDHGERATGARALYTGTGPGAVSTGTRLPLGASTGVYRQRHSSSHPSAPPPPPGVGFKTVGHQW